MMRAFIAPIVINALEADKDREKLVDELFDRFRRRIAAAPRQHEHYLAVVMIEKLAM